VIPEDVAVTGLGLVTRAGIGAAAAWAAAAGGRPPPAADPALAGLAWPFTCRVADGVIEDAVGPARSWRYDRYTQLAWLAAREAVASAGLDPGQWDGDRVAVVWGTAIGGAGTVAEQQHAFDLSGARDVSPYLLPKTMTNMAAGSIAVEFGARGPCLGTVTACASGLTALGMAVAMLRAGLADIALAGAAEAAFPPLYIAGFGQMGVLSKAGMCRPFDRDRDGFVPGEGAALLVLERAAHARARRARILALTAGYGASADGYHLAQPDPSGADLAAAIRAALRDAAAGPEDLDVVYAHGTSTRAGDEAEAAALGAAAGGCPVACVKAAFGHTFGVSGAISAALAVLGIARQQVIPVPEPHHADPALPVEVLSGDAAGHRTDLVLCPAMGFGGQNAAVVLAAP
jgi:3-oxoacyl-[acyl-carrier-protein] synthase II